MKLALTAAMALSLLGGRKNHKDNPATPETPKRSMEFLSTEKKISRHTLDRLNAYRATNGVPALTEDDRLTNFAEAGSDAIAKGGPAHGHFQSSYDNTIFCNTGGENQAPGWPVSNADTAVDAVLVAMMNEGPGGGHHDNILDPEFTRVGISVLVQNGLMYFTNDFGGACQK